MEDYSIDFEKIPDHFKTEAICFAAVSNSGDALEFVPESLKTEEICLAAVNETVYGLDALDFVPENINLESFLFSAMEDGVLDFEDIPDRLKTESFLLIAMEEGVLDFEDIPDHLKTESLYLAVMKGLNDKNVFSSVVPHRLTSEVKENSNQGYVYIAVNNSIQGMVKIGKTTRSPDERIKELSSATGVPTPFFLAHFVKVSDCTEAENYIHTRLESQGYRTSQYRPFFNVPLHEAIQLLIELETIFPYLEE
jgi:hypothetical protein